MNSDRYLEYYCAVWWAGAVVNPVNIRWSPAEVAHSLDDCETAVLVVDDAFKGAVDELRRRSKALRTVIHCGSGDAPEGCLSLDALIAAAAPIDDAMRGGEDLAGIFYTGGTTGFPKGVMLTHTNLASNALSNVAEQIVHANGVTLFAAPMFHLANGAAMLASMTFGNLTTFVPAWYHTAEGQKAGKMRSGGRATFTCEVRIVDAEDREVPRGSVGEVCVRGPGVMKGYWNQPGMSATALRGGWMHTGDAAYMDADGFVFIVDRVKDMIVTGGENVYSAEVENAVAQHPAVAACAVIGIPSEQWGEAVHATVVLKAGQAATPEEITAHCKTLIANYKCPRSVAFVEALPLSGAGKVLKTKLREPFWQGRQRNVA